MHKILLTILLCMTYGVGYAATTCLQNNTLVFTIRRSENGISSSYNTDDLTWSVVFGYDLVPGDSAHRTIYGNATCNEIATTADDAAVKMGDSNVYLRASSLDIGTMCWCAMSVPISSWWVFYKSYSDEDACATNCARDCAGAMQSDTDNFRSNGLYQAIW